MSKKLFTFKHVSGWMLLTMVVTNLMTGQTAYASYDDNGIISEDNDIYEETEDVGQEIADFAVQYVGYPYVYGGTSLTNGADCSGFVQTIFSLFGYSLPRTAAEQYYSATWKSLDALTPGDLVFYGSDIHHVAIYIGDGQIVHAANSESGIKISDMYYSTPYAGGTYLY